MPTVHSISIAGLLFHDLMLVQAADASAAIVGPGDSGTAVLMQSAEGWVWIGIVIAMLAPQQAVVCKLPNAMRASDIEPRDFPQERLWTL